jgi:hypothetical protein
VLELVAHINISGRPSRREQSERHDIFFEKNSFSFHRIQEQKLLQLQGKP